MCFEMSQQSRAKDKKAKALEGYKDSLDNEKEADTIRVVEMETAR